MRDQLPQRVDELRVLVIGGASGIGAASVARLRSEGATVACADLHGMPGDIIAMDVTDPASIDDGVASANAAMGGLDAVVNCAGILGRIASVEDSTAAEFEAVIRVNLIGAFLVARATLPLMRDRKFGRFVQLASIAGKEGNPQMGAYSASKAGVIGLVKALGREYADTGVTINAIAPASIDTAMTRVLSDERREIQRRLIPMGRFGTPEEAAALVSFVISPQNSFTTGFVYDLSGGRATY